VVVASASPPSPDTPAVQVRVARPTDVEAAAALLARSFEEEPGNVALFPDRDARRAVFVTGARRAIQEMLPYGATHLAQVGTDLAAAALWHPPGVRTASVRASLGTVLATLTDPRTLASALPHATSVVVRNLPEGIGLTLARRRAIARASHGTTWHLAYLGTAPEHRGRGLARALLDRQLQRCDEDGLAVWLETTDPVNPPIYERFGFDVVAHVTDAAWLPGFWVMRRPPAAR
jgi:GNAT superfamily N-acetyltransferase